MDKRWNLIELSWEMASIMPVGQAGVREQKLILPVARNAEPDRGSRPLLHEGGLGMMKSTGIAGRCGLLASWNSEWTAQARPAAAALASHSVEFKCCKPVRA